MGRVWDRQRASGVVKLLWLCLSRFAFDRFPGLPARSGVEARSAAPDSHGSHCDSVLAAA